MTTATWTTNLGEEAANFVTEQAKEKLRALEMQENTNDR